MRKLLAIICLLTVMLLPQTGLAKKAKKDVPKPAWVVVAQNKGGIYYYDKNSLVYFPDSAQPQDIVEINVVAKADILDKNFQQQLQNKYGKKLKNGDLADKCLLHLVLNKQAKTYKIIRVELFSEAGTSLVEKELDGKMEAIPPKTFVAVLLDETIKILQPSNSKNETAVKEKEIKENINTNKGAQNADKRISKNTKVSE